MKVKVINAFRDAYKLNEDGSFIIYKVGQELEISKERYEEIKEYVEIINATRKDKTGKVEA